jgi:ribosomal protein L20
MPLLQGRAKMEKKLAVRRVLGNLRRETNARLEDNKFMGRSIMRASVNAAAREHGTDWGRLRIDLSRQDVTLFPTTLKTLAVYEPMSFRALAELAASGIMPPTPAAAVSKPMRAPLAQLDADVAAIRAHRSSAVSKDDGLRDAWRRYAQEDEL